MAPAPHLIALLQDDLGYADVAFTATNVSALPEWVAAASPRITQLARSGIVLDRHYAHFHCSPSRRSFLTGRLPVHHGDHISDIQGDDIDLRFTTVGQKLEQAGYACYYFGKGPSCRGATCRRTPASPPGMQAFSSAQDHTTTRSDGS